MLPVMWHLGQHLLGQEEGRDVYSHASTFSMGVASHFYWMPQLPPSPRVKSTRLLPPWDCDSLKAICGPVWGFLDLTVLGRELAKSRAAPPIGWANLGLAM